MRSTSVKSGNVTVGFVVIRKATDEDADTVAALLRAADDAKVVSAAGIRHSRRTQPERARRLELVAARGRYAQMFELQASHYREEPTGASGSGTRGARCPRQAVKTTHAAM